VSIFGSVVLHVLGEVHEFFELFDGEVEGAD
jgi:hypothetical protein